MGSLTNFHQNTCKVSKLVLSWDPFVQSTKCKGWKFTDELCVMTMKNGEKSEEELTCRFKIDIRNLTNFYSSTWVWKIYTLMGCFWPKYIIFERKKYRGDIFHETRQWCKIWRKLSCGSENDMRNLAKFHQNTQKSQNWDLYCVLLSKVENVWA